MAKDFLPKALPTEMGVDPKALLSLLDQIEEQKIALHGLIIVRHGRTIAQGWWKPCSPDYTHMLFSLSKSFTSTAVGFAVQEGLLSLDDKLVKFFPEKLPLRPCEGMERLTLRDMITMSTGHEAEPALDGEDWVDNFLRSYIPLEPGSRFLYNTAATYVLSAVLQKVTGMPTGEYLRPRLFEPLGIEDWWWESCPKGIHTGGFGLNIHTRDIARFGQFLLQKGMWEGRQLLDPAWIAEATAYQVKNFGEKDWGAGYGYQFWQCVPEGVFRGDGAFGQLCVVLPEQDMVLAVNAGLGDMQQELDVFWDNLLPGVHEAPLPEDPDAQAELTRRLSSLRIAPPEGMPDCETARRISGAEYELSDNAMELSKISLTFGETSAVSLTVDGKTICLPIGFSDWAEAETGVTREELNSHTTRFYERAACAGAWEAGEYLLDIAYPTTPFINHLRFAFDENALCLSLRINVGFQKTNLRIIGRRTGG